MKVDIGLATRETLVVITARRKECQCQRVKVGDKKNYPGISKELAQGWIWYTLNPSSCWKTIIFRNKLAKPGTLDLKKFGPSKVWVKIVWAQIFFIQFLAESYHSRKVFDFFAEAAAMANVAEGVIGETLETL